MQRLNLLRKLLELPLQAEVVSYKGRLPPNELRFILEFADPPSLNQCRAEVKDLLKSDQFVLEPLGASQVLVRFAALRFPQLERTLSNRDLFGIAYELVDSLGLRSAEPELGIKVFEDPRPQPDDVVETAAISGLCWVDIPPPDDPRWALKNIRAIDAWALTKGSGIVVAQPDTGVAAHDAVPRTSLSLEQAADILDGDADPEDPLDGHAANPGHGTATASVLVSPEDGAISGVAPAARVAPIRCITDVKIFNTGPVAAAIAHAVEAKCHVISMSLGGVPGRAMRHAIKEAINNDMIVIAAAGNCVRLVVWPAKYSEVIAVGGTNVSDMPWKGSSRGSAVDICAPAELVWRAELGQSTDGTSKVSPGQGTSFATAMVAGCAALWLSHHGRQHVINEARRRATSVQNLFRTALRATARRPGQWDQEDFGSGVVDAFALVSLPLADIPGGGEAVFADQDIVHQLLDGACTVGTFDADRYGLEMATITLEYAKLGGGLDSLSVEAKVDKTRPSPQLSDAAAKSNDPSIGRFAEAPDCSIARPLVYPTVPLDFRRLRLAVPLSTRAESTGSSFSEQAARDFLRETRSARLQRAESIFNLNLNLSDATRSSAINQVDEAINAIARGEDKLTRAAHIGLEALIRMTGRPVIRVRNNTVDLSDPRVGDWYDRLFLLIQQQPDFITRTQSAGRIDLDGVHVGSGSVVGPGLVLTNRHVLQALAAPVPRRNNPDRWVFSGDQATIDFAEEPSSATARSRFRVTGVVGAGPSHIDLEGLDFTNLDAALLEVETVNEAGNVLPESIGLVRTATRLDRRQELFVVGYPARPGVLPRQNDSIDIEVVQRLNELFGLDYGTKYIAPGEVNLSTGGPPGDLTKWVFSHDATTLGGNSGSCIFGLGAPFGVVGLHFGGSWRRANYAHALGSITRDGNFLTDARVKWED